MSPAFKFSTSDYVHQLQLALRQCAVDAHSINTRPFELQAESTVTETLVPQLCAIAEAAIAVMGQVLTQYEPPKPTAGPETSGEFHVVFEDLVDDASMSTSDQHQRIADVAFMARWELERKHKQLLAAAKSQHGWALLSECCSMRRRVLKATSGVERVLCATEMHASMFDDLYQTERQIAIETRAAYYRFVKDLTKAEQDCEATGLNRLVRLAGTGIATLIGRDIYDALRVEDRMEMRRLQARVVTWLRETNDDREAQRLMGDMRAFASLLMQVNRRSVLIEHDLAVLVRLLAALRLPNPDKDSLYPQLETLRGRDEGLDCLIEGYAELQPRWWSHHVSRVFAQLSETTEPSKAPEWS